MQSPERVSPSTQYSPTREDRLAGPPFPFARYSRLIGFIQKTVALVDAIRSVVRLARIDSVALQFSRV